MNFLAPGWIALAAGASLVVAAIHLIAWRLPRTVVLPTARFVPDEPARRAARTIRPADLALLALRVAIIMAGGLALAHPRLAIAPSGAATVIVVERSAASGDSAALRDSVQAIPTRDHASFVVFDTAARVHSNVDAAMSDALGTGAERNASLTVGLIAAAREARRLARDYESVDVVLVSTFARAHFDRATLDARNTWGDSIRVVRLPLAPAAQRAGRADVRAEGDDPVAAGVRLAQSHGLIRGESRVLRGALVPDDSAWAAGGGALVVWPKSASSDSDNVDGVHTDGATAIGYFVRTPLPGDSGRVVARWVDGMPAVVESAMGEGCRRTVGFDVRDAGDFVLTPSFQRLLASVLAPCGDGGVEGMASDSVIAALVTPAVGGGTIKVPDESTAPSRISALLMALAIALALAELLVRRRMSARPLEQFA